MDFANYITNAEPAPQPASHVYSDFENSTYLIVSKIAYLIGVPKKFLKMSTSRQSWMFINKWIKTKTHELSGICV